MSTPGPELGPIICLSENMSILDPDDEFAQLVQAHQHQVMSYIYALVHNLHDAEDLYQQTLEILWAKFDQFQRTGHFGRWACGVARLEVANFRRRKQDNFVFPSPELLEQLIEPATRQDASMRELYHEALAACRSKLTESDQLLLKLFYNGDQTAKEIAASQNRTLAGVYNALSRIRILLLDCIKHRLAREATP